MKRLLVSVVAAIVSCVGSAAEQGAVWSTAVSTRPSDGHRVIFRYRSEFEKSFKRSTYPDRVTIAWAYMPSNGMPARDETAAMDQMEDLLEPYVENTSLSILVLVTTGEGRREWVYYTKSKTEFMAAMNKALAGKSRFPVEIDLWTDPKWSRYDEFKSQVRP